MKQVLPADSIGQGTADKDDPFRYGWRYVRRVQPDGTEVLDEVPLSLEDLLYPEEGDFVVYEPVHTRDFLYCFSTLETFYAAQPDVVVLGDCRVDWGVEGVRPLGPDIVVFFDVRQWLRRATFRRAEEGGRPVLVVEIASPSTRVHDLGAKLDLYYRVGVQQCVIVDRGPQNEDPVRLIGYRRGPRGWLPLVPDTQGRLDLTPVGLLLGVEDDHPWLYDAITGVREPDRTALRHALTNAETRAQDAETRAQDAETRAQDAEARAYAEAQARAALEARLRALEEELQRQRGARDL